MSENVRMLELTLSGRDADDVERQLLRVCQEYRGTPPDRWKITARPIVQFGSVPELYEADCEAEWDA